MTRITLPAQTLAEAWLNATLCSSNDPDRPVMYRTASVEIFPTGIQIVATDSFMLFGCYVPSAENDLTRPPDIDDAPTESYVVMDLDHRMRSLMKHMRREGIAAAKNNEPCDVTLSFRSSEAASTPTLAPELDRRSCVVRTPNETLALPLYESDYPTWRELIAPVPEPAKSMVLSPALLGRFGKLVGVGPVTFTFAGDTGLVRVDDLAGESYLFGGLMPSRGAS